MINRYKVSRLSGSIAIYSMSFIGWTCLILFVASSGSMCLMLAEREGAMWIGVAIPTFILLFMCLLRFGVKADDKNPGWVRMICVGDKSYLSGFYDKFVGIQYDPFSFGASVNEQ